MPVPDPTPENYPITFRKWGIVDEADNWLAVFLPLIAAAEIRMRSASPPQTIVSVEQIDALSLSPSEWAKIILDPKATARMEAVINLGVDGLKTTPELDSWIDRNLRLAKELGAAYRESIGGALLWKKITGSAPR